MPTEVDIVVGVDHTSSIASYYKSICRMIMYISTMALANIQGEVRIALIKFRSKDDTWTTNIYGFTGNRDTLEQWLNTDQPVGGSKDEHEAVGDALSAALSIAWRTNVDGLSVKKLVILITDGAPSGLFEPLVGEDPWTVSKEFKKKGITLAVVGVEPGIVECDDFYCALALNTGGKYIPLINAERILSGVIESVISSPLTFQRAFEFIIKGKIEENSSFKYSYIEKRVDGMINECETIADIRRFFYNHRH